MANVNKYETAKKSKADADAKAGTTVAGADKANQAAKLAGELVAADKESKPLAEAAEQLKKYAAEREKKAKPLRDAQTKATKSFAEAEKKYKEEEPKREPAKKAFAEAEKAHQAADAQRTATSEAAKKARDQLDQLSQQLSVALGGYKSSVWSVAFSPDGKQLATGSHNDSLRIWDLATLEKPQERFPSK